LDTIELELASRIVGACCEEAAGIGIRVSVVVADSAGHLITAARMDGATFGSMSIALDKAYSAAAFARPTSLWAESTVPGEANWGLQEALGGRMTVYGGGLPALSNGRLIGAVGVSGSAASNDVRCARAGISAAGLETNDE
jgi:uncharacterized protein GlcG (DUF336 family)